MTEFGSYTGEQFFSLQFPERKFLVDKIIREKDSVLFVGGEKSGKTLLIQQLICALTSGEQPFLDTFVISKPCKVTYVQLEGELGDTQNRFKRMIKSLDFNKDNFHLIFSGPMRLQELGQITYLIKAIEKVHIPDVIIIDPLYFACSGGSLSDDEHIIQFLGNIRVLKDHFGCAVIVIHHTHKVKLDTHGNLIKEGDDATFGSVFLKAWPDHLLFFYFEKATQLRHLYCGTQRSGDIVKHMKLRLIQPDPLYFEEEFSKSDGKIFGIQSLLNKSLDGLPASEICKLLEISEATFYRAVKEGLNNNIISKSNNGRPVIYSVSQSLLLQ